MPCFHPKSEQKSSYEAQVDHYTQRIRQNLDWFCVGIFADQGMSGASADKRKEFQKMMRACRAGKIETLCLALHHQDGKWKERLRFTDGWRDSFAPDDREQHEPAD